MKYFYLGIFILCMLICVCWFSQREIELRTDAVAAPLEEALSAVKQSNFAHGRSLLADGAEIWSQHEGFLASLMSHSYTREVDEALATREVVPDSDLRRFLARLLHAVRTISEVDKPLWRNSF